MRDSWIQTYSGGIATPLDLRHDQVNLNDVAHALAHKCRFNGHCTEFYSVAQHALLVSKIAADLAIGRGLDGVEYALAGLHHDDGEAYLPDVSSPIKQYVSVANVPFSAMEDRHHWVICEALGVPVFSGDVVETVEIADRIALDVEALAIMSECCRPWIKNTSPEWEIGAALNPQAAKFQFIELHNFLMGANT